MKHFIFAVMLLSILCTLSSVSTSFFNSMSDLNLKFCKLFMVSDIFLYKSDWEVNTYFASYACMLTVNMSREREICHCREIILELGRSVQPPKWSPNRPRNDHHFFSRRPRNDPQLILGMEWYGILELWIDQIHDINWSFTSYSLEFR